jgi:hypothetical protein
MEYFMLACFEYLAHGLRAALLLYAGVVCLRWGLGGKIFFEPKMVWEFLWAWWLVALLRATGFAGLAGGWRWSVFTPVRFALGLDRDGFVRALLVSVLMFAPCGFLTPRALSGECWNMRRTVILGALISYFVVMLQLPSGGPLELGRLLEGAIGTAAGYLAHSLLMAFQRYYIGAIVH